MIGGAITSVILDAAVKVGAPIIKSVLKDALGDGPVGGVADAVADAIAGQLGVPKEEIPAQPPVKIEEAVMRVEAEQGPEIIVAHTAAQREANRLMLAEMEKAGESFWAWAWRPAWMWLLGFLWAWAIIIHPLLRATWIMMLEPLDVATLLAVTGIFVTFYMGGHTAKDVVEKWKEAKQSEASP